MPLSLHTLKPKAGSRTKRFRIGRGPGTGRGKTAGRGTKGQRSRTGGRKGLRLKGMKQMLLGFPKLRGFQSRSQKAVIITLTQLAHFEEGATVTMQSLRKAGFLLRGEQEIKVVGGGEMKKKMILKGLAVTASAKAAIEKAGGKIET
ncbi:50S ribosomal protein L15 [Candidatus Uhrbacteria bacterium]|nr:50S ribosomal protein L15 [Candidatus Uhrbacteria bacterium]